MDPAPSSAFNPYLYQQWATATDTLASGCLPDMPMGVFSAAQSADIQNTAMKQDSRDERNDEACLVPRQYKDYASCPLPIPEKRKPRRGVAKPFPEQLHRMLEDAEKENMTDVVCWQPHGRAFVVRDKDRFMSEIMPKYFNQSQFASFQRQLNIYGFVRFRGDGPDKGGYYHERFLRGMPELCSGITRANQGKDARLSSHTNNDPNFYGMRPAPKSKASRSTLARPRTVGRSKSEGASASICAPLCEPLRADEFDPIDVNPTPPHSGELITRAGLVSQRPNPISNQGRAVSSSSGLMKRKPPALSHQAKAVSTGGGKPAVFSRRSREMGLINRKPSVLSNQVRTVSSSDDEFADSEEECLEEEKPCFLPLPSHKPYDSINNSNYYKNNDASPIIGRSRPISPMCEEGNNRDTQPLPYNPGHQNDSLQRWLEGGAASDTKPQPFYRGYENANLLQGWVGRPTVSDTKPPPVCCNEEEKNESVQRWLEGSSSANDSNPAPPASPASPASNNDGQNHDSILHLWLEGRCNNDSKPSTLGDDKNDSFLQLWLEGGPGRARSPLPSASELLMDLDF